MIISKQLGSENEGYDGCYPVLIAVEHDHMSHFFDTRITCQQSHWIKEKGCVSDADILHRVKNEAIESVFRRIAGRIQDCLDDLIQKNFKIIVTQSDGIREQQVRTEYVPEKRVTADVPGNYTLIQLIDKKIATLTTLNTLRGYQSFRRYVVSNYGEGLPSGSIGRSFISEFDLKLKADFKFHQPTRHLMLSRMRAVLNHAIDHGYISQRIAFKVPKAPFFPRDRNLSDTMISNIFSLYKGRLSENTGLDDPLTFALGLFILDIAFQGLAPVDLASLKVCQVKLTKLTPPVNTKDNIRLYLSGKGIQSDSGGPMDVVIINTNRQKTGNKVTIVVAYRPIRHILDKLLIRKCGSDYLIPCFDIHKTYTPQQRQDRLANYFHKQSEYLNKALVVSSLQHDETGEARHITFYYARHAFCNLIDSLDVPRHLIQHMIGHRTTILETNYLRKITPWEQALLSRHILSPLL